MSTQTGANPIAQAGACANAVASNIKTIAMERRRFITFPKVRTHVELEDDRSFWLEKSMIAPSLVNLILQFSRLLPLYKRM